MFNLLLSLTLALTTTTDNPKQCAKYSPTKCEETKREEYGPAAHAAICVPQWKIDCAGIYYILYHRSEFSAECRKHLLQIETGRHFGEELAHPTGCPHHIAMDNEFIVNKRK